MSRGIAVIRTVALSTTHDGEGALTVEVEFSNGGRSIVQLSSEDTAHVFERAGVQNAEGLVGMPWTILQIRDVEAAAR